MLNPFFLLLQNIAPSETNLFSCKTIVIASFLLVYRNLSLVYVYCLAIRALFVLLNF